MKRALFIGVFLIVSFSVSAQTSLVGRVYHHPNIMENEINHVVKDASKDLSKARAEAIAKGEKKKGRKLTEKELKELDKSLEEAQKMIKALKDGMKTAVTVTFKDEKNLVMKADMKIDDEVMKAAGIPWAKRKLLKLGVAMAPSQKATYIIKDNLVIVTDEEGPDTLRLSDDGKYLIGTMDKTKFRLTRIK